MPDLEMIDTAKARRVPLRSLGLVLALISLLATGCGSGGSSGVGAQPFTLQEVGVSQGQTWQINRPIAFTFSQPVDFSTVNLNTINVAQISGAPALGSFSQDEADPRRVTFHPTCPTKPDFSDAGLLPGGITYRILVPGADSSSLTVRSTSGKPLKAGHTQTFLTPDSTVLTELFLDLVNGPPAPLLQQQPGQVATRLVIGGDTSEAVPFVSDGMGHGVLANGMAVPLNLYSQPESRIELVIEFNQPVNPSAENISATRLRLQYDADLGSAEDWQPIATRVELLANCTVTGAAVRLTPIGVLPQDRDLRAFVSAEFEDLVGDRNILPLVDFARMTSDFFKDGLGDPIAFTDELREEFVLGGNQAGSLEDTSAVFAGPAANWSNGSLRAAFGFSGTGGPGANFDFHVPPNQDFILDTTSSVITGGPGGLPVTQQLVIGGVLDVRDLFIPASSTLRVQGPNAALFLCSGKVEIQGKLIVSGNAARNIFTVLTPNIPEPGAAGQAGGGRGGTSSFITTGPTPRGGTGWGAFNVEGLGGEGGESGWATTVVSNGANRRGAGGGGGSLGHDQIIDDPEPGCPEQSILGMDGEDGFPGSVDAFSAIRPTELMPWGGRFGPRPFVNPTGSAAEREDDFYGVKVADFNTSNPRLVVGELPKPWAGAGGGAGGDSMRLPNGFPPPEFLLNEHNKGAGGGGGGGSLHIQALGSIVFGPAGMIEARGGQGGRGESTGGTNAIGAGSGGGSGGHVILQTAELLNLSALSPTAPALIVRGGQGGAGANNVGGAKEAGETGPFGDAVHTGGVGGVLPDNPFSLNACPPGNVNIVTGAGGDGSPGILQIHVSDLTTDIWYPGQPQPGGTTVGVTGSLREVCKPAPHGYDRISGLWHDHLIPEFGSISRAQSKWIPLGGVTVAPGTTVPSPIAFFFEGTDVVTGEVEASGEAVVDLDPILVAAAPLELEPPHTIQLSGADLEPGSSFYKDNPNLLERFDLDVAGERFDVATASYDGSSDVFTLTVASDGPPLPPGGAVELRPRFFGVVTNENPGFLPQTAKVKVEFQATSSNPMGDPDVTGIFPGLEDWAVDITDLTNAPANTSFGFYRFRVTFDIGEELDFDTPRPGLDFLRVPFRF